MSLWKKLLGMDDEPEQAPRSSGDSSHLEAIRAEALGVVKSTDPEIPEPAPEGYRWRVEELYSGRYELKLVENGASRMSIEFTDGESYNGLENTRSASQKLLKKHYDAQAVKRKLDRINGAS